MQIVSVVGARPQFIKAAVVSHALEAAGIPERIVHTGQHYDARMSSVFFEELGIPEPVANLDVGSASHAVQTGSIMVRFEEYLASGPLPDWILVYGDTNSTLAAALVASKLQIRLAHVEAGLRSFNRRMPEEINRIVTDRLSDLLFCPTRTAVSHLEKEGLSGGVHLTGDVMLDATRFFGRKAEENHPIANLTRHPAGSFHLATVHRAENTDDPERLASIIRGLGRSGLPVLLPMHPRTRSRVKRLVLPENIEVIPPVSYLAMLSLVRAARRVFTDSGGLQKEALWLGTPCITLRDETEWVETLNGGWNILVGADAGRIESAATEEPSASPPEFGSVADGRASDLIASLLNSN